MKNESTFWIPWKEHEVMSAGMDEIDRFYSNPDSMDLIMQIEARQKMATHDLVADLADSESSPAASVCTSTIATRHGLTKGMTGTDEMKGELTEQPVLHVGTGNVIKVCGNGKGSELPAVSTLSVPVLANAQSKCRQCDGQQLSKTQRPVPLLYPDEHNSQHHRPLKVTANLPNEGPIVASDTSTSQVDSKQCPIGSVVQDAEHPERRDTPIHDSDVYRMASGAEDEQPDTENQVDLVVSEDAILAAQNLEKNPVDRSIEQTDPDDTALPPFEQVVLPLTASSTPLSSHSGLSEPSSPLMTPPTLSCDVQDLMDIDCPPQDHVDHVEPPFQPAQIVTDLLAVDVETSTEIVYDEVKPRQTRKRRGRGSAAKSQHNWYPPRTRQQHRQVDRLLDVASEKSLETDQKSARQRPGRPRGSKEVRRRLDG